MSTTENKLLFPVTGMTCSACAARIEKALNRADGVSSAAVNFATEKAEVRWDPTQLTSADVQTLITNTGFGVSKDAHAFAIQGMTCSACASRIEKVLRKLPGVLEANINFALENATVTAVSGAASIADIVNAIDNAGFKALPADTDQAQDQDAAALEQERKQLNIAMALTAPLVLQMVMQWLGFKAFHLTPEAQVLLATPVQFIFGKRFYVAAFNSLKNGAANMDVLVVMGTTAAYLYSWYIMLVLGTNMETELYFEASAVIITLVMLGKYMEARAKRSTTEAIRQLMDLRPESATVLRDGEEITVGIEQVLQGDLVIVKPGSNIPVDGIVSEGGSDVDESLITGESIPVSKAAGDTVTGGAVNGTGRLIVAATAVGQDSTLAKIIHLVENAQAGKAPVQRLVDKVSAIFVPVVVCIALLTFGLTWWYFDHAGTGLIAAVSVLVIACPCALGLATPTAIMTGTGAAARAGILIRDVESLERAHELNAIIFDKTGTLTEGRPQVTTLHAFDGDTKRLIQLAASVQAASEHPLAAAVMRKADAEQVEAIPVNNFESHTGSGVSGQVGDTSVFIGRQGFVAEHCTDLSFGEDIATLWEERGNTVVWLIASGQLTGLIAIADQLRETSPDAVNQLRKMNVKTVLLSGDAVKVAEKIGEEANVDESYGGVLPDGKAERVVAMTKDGYHVGMIGDGINDAPALAAAHVGIAMGSGTDIAMETASITLMRNDPRLVPGAIEISRATWRKIRQNLFWAFVYNVIGIPLAALGYLSPTLAGAAMAMSSVSVVGNSLLLKNWRPSTDKS